MSESRANKVHMQAKHLAARVDEKNERHGTGLEFRFNGNPGAFSCYFQVWRNGILLCQSNNPDDILFGASMFVLGWEHSRGALGYRTVLGTGEACHEEE